MHIQSVRDVNIHAFVILCIEQWCPVICQRSEVWPGSFHSFISSRTSVTPRVRLTRLWIFWIERALRPCVRQVSCYFLHHCHSFPLDSGKKLDYPGPTVNWNHRRGGNVPNFYDPCQQAVWLTVCYEKDPPHSSPPPIRSF